LPNPVLRVGLRAPSFTLDATRTDRFRLTEMRGRWVVLYFYNKDGTPGCTAEACDFRDLYAEFKRRGAIVVGASACQIDSHEDFARELGLPYPLVCDHDRKVAAKYGVWRDKQQNSHRYLGLVRSTVLIDPGGKVARVFDNARVKGHAAKVLAALDKELEAR